MIFCCSKNKKVQFCNSNQFRKNAGFKIGITLAFMHLTRLCLMGTTRTRWKSSLGQNFFKKKKKNLQFARVKLKGKGILMVRVKMIKHLKCQLGNFSWKFFGLNIKIKSYTKINWNIEKGQISLGKVLLIHPPFLLPSFFRK